MFGHGSYMSRKKKIIEEPIKKYYSLEKIQKEKAHYNIIIGERSNGKTYSVEEYAIMKFFESGCQLGLIRRYELDFTGKRGQSMFESLVKNGVVKKYSKNVYDNITYYSSRWYFSKYDDKAKKNVLSPKPFAYAFSLNSGEHDKSTSYPDVKIVFFDEFISRNGYLPDEFILFMNTLSTIVRDRIDVEIYMLANTISKFCPYFSEMGLTNITKMEQGTIDVYKYGESELKVAVERCKPNKEGKKSDTLFAFNNPKLEMITHGGWEIALYPHLPCKYKRLDIKFIFYIEFNDHLFQCEIIRIGRTIDFLYIHKKTTMLKLGKRDIIFSNKISNQKNYIRRITAPQTDIQRKILKYFMYDKVFYQDNEIGEIIRNYLIWCKS